MGLLKRKEEKTEVISVRVPGSAKAELDELRQRAEAGGFDLAGSMSEAVVRIIRQIGAELREPPATDTDNQARCDRSGGPMCPGRSMVRRRSHSCGVERAAADAACSPVALRGGRHRASLPAASVQCIRECSKPAQWQCEVGLTCCARFLEGHVTHYAMTAGRANP